MLQLGSFACNFALSPWGSVRLGRAGWMKAYCIEVWYRITFGSLVFILFYEKSSVENLRKFPRNLKITLCALCHTPSYSPAYVWWVRHNWPSNLLLLRERYWRDPRLPMLSGIFPDDVICQVIFLVMYNVTSMHHVLLVMSKGLYRKWSGQ